MSNYNSSTNTYEFRQPEGLEKPRSWSPDDTFGGVMKDYVDDLRCVIQHGAVEIESEDDCFSSSCPYLRRRATESQAVEDESGDACVSSCCSYLRRQATSYNGPVGNNSVRPVRGSHRSREGVR